MFVKPWRLRRHRFAASGLDEHPHPWVVGCRGCYAALCLRQNQSHHL